MGLLLWIIPLAAIALLALPGSRGFRHAVSLGAAILQAAVAVPLTRAVLMDGSVRYGWLGGIFYLDPVSIVLLDVMLVISLLTGVYTIGYIEAEIRRGDLQPKRVQLLYILINAFLLTMILSLTVSNLGVMWIAIEATTLASVFLVGFHSGKAAVEAAWKYIIICSVGITIAMLGIIFLHSAAAGVLDESATLDWPALLAKADALDGRVLRLAFLFILIGFGTKAGLAPMHTWLPDAHSQAPSPVSALLSGVLLNAAMYAIIRTVAIVNKCLGDSRFTGNLLIAAGVLSIAAAAVFILTQKDYKRLLAYSSIEHMGIVALAIGLFTPASLFAAFFHLLNHSFTKSMLFLASGTVLQKYGTREISKVRGLLRVLPVTGPVFLIGLIAIGGTPPFSIFTSEFNVLAAAFQNGRLWLGFIVAVLLALVFAGMIHTLFRMFFGRGRSGEEPAGLDDGTADGATARPGEENRAGAAILVMLLIVVVGLGLFLPSWLKNLLEDARRIIYGG
ncbi:MAG: hydrogenase 4 subunit F [Clostridiaceae bacterium]|nr:hydrogenase 4 subunit F [Clostridiaceae bacterium]